MPILDDEIDAAFPQNVPAEPLGTGNASPHLKNQLLKKMRDEAVIAASGLTVQQANALAAVVAGTAPGVDSTARSFANSAAADAAAAQSSASSLAAAIASANYLLPSSIGQTVQGYSANLAAWASRTVLSKQDTLVSGTNIRTLNGQSLLGSGDIEVVGGGSPASTPITEQEQAVAANHRFIVIRADGSPAFISPQVLYTYFAGEPPGPSAPAVMTTGQWTLAPIAGGLRIGLVSPPAGSPTSYQYSLNNGGTWATLPGAVAMGTRDITGLPATSTQVRLRAVNAAVPAPDPGSDTKTETPLPVVNSALTFVRASAVRAGDFGSSASLTFPANVAAGNHVLALFTTDSQSLNFSGAGAVLDGTIDRSTSYRAQGLRIPSVSTPATVFPFTLSSGWNFGGGAVEVSGPPPVFQAAFGGFDSAISGAERQLSITVTQDNSLVLLSLAPQDSRNWTWGGDLQAISSDGYSPMAWAQLDAGTHTLRFTPNNSVTLNGFAAFVWSPGA